MLVHAQVDHAVVEAAISACLTHDEQRGGLLAATVASRALPRRQRLHQPMRQTALRLLESLGERAHGILADEDIALRGEVRPRHPTRPGKAVRASKSRRAPLRVHNPNLALLWAIIRARQRGDSLLRRLALRQQVEATRAIARVRPGLRRHRADTGFGERHDRADGEKLRLHRDAEVARLRIEPNDGESGDARVVADHGHG